ncbi:5-dehydro-2-deoxygluconokinase [Nocardia arizonensis]|uniref:5-dehydro-2-deoxygluconokinase n=1 Tax=Nocardia arizonensis TaxID=1141647 RepID=UPI0006CFDDCC|nr:5-dehydro-2-deoxygluconokinase [Nocardia arizonensis]
MNDQPEVLTVGRVGVDLYPQQSGVPLAEVASFAKSLGGTATNVAVAAARLGRRSAVLTKVGPDGFGDYVRTALETFGVAARYVGTAPNLLTPVVFCELTPPTDPPLLFYRAPIAPDLTLTAADVPWDVVDSVPLLWVTGTGVSVEPARETQRAILRRRGRRDHTVLDLDYRPMFWSAESTARARIAELIEWVSVVVGNREEMRVVVGTADPEAAADRLLAAGVRLAVVKCGADGVLIATAEERCTVPAHPVEVVCGLGAGDGFGGALVHGLLAGWPPRRLAAYANAAGALVAGRLACADAMPTREQIERLLAVDPATMRPEIRERAR